MILFRLLRHFWDRMAEDFLACGRSFSFLAVMLPADFMATRLTSLRTFLEGSPC